MLRGSDGFGPDRTTMDRRESWKLATHLNVYQIALLMAGYDPGQFGMTHPTQWPNDVRNEAEPYTTAITNAVLEGGIAHSRVETVEYNESVIDWFLTRIEVGGFRDWLVSRNYRDGFFLADNAEADPLLDRTSEFYAPKLAAAVRAWREVTADPDALNGKTPKKALEIWLKTHAAEFGLLDRDGNPIKQALEDICKVANWRPEGGATRTPTHRPKIGDPTPQPATHPPLRSIPPTPTPPKDLDEEIPF